MQITVGERLKQLVRERGIEQQEAAAQLNLKSPTFNGYVGNKREPSISKLKQLACYFNVSVDYLIGYSEIRNPYLSHLSEEINDFIQNPENVDFVELAKDIKERTIVAGNKSLLK
ncbi:MAG: helix-turn-helix domain-containing protein [Ruminiclostridium sp.]